MPPPEHATSAETAWQIVDLRFQGVPGVIAAYLAISEDEVALVETGPSTTRRALERALQANGRSVNDLTHIIVTHIHLDHAGGAGTLMRDAPNARLSVHPAGWQHMIDPSRLLASAGRLYGDRMETLWGEVVGCPEDRVDVLEDGSRLEVAGRRLLVKDAPGHAGHHLVLLDEDSGTLFAGDVGGVRMPETSVVVLPTPPPEIDIEAWRDTIHMIRGFAPQRLALTHSGVFEDVEWHLDRLEASLDEMLGLARSVLVPGGSVETLDDAIFKHVSDQLTATDAPQDAARQVQYANPTLLCAQGLHRVLRKAGEL